MTEGQRKVKLYMIKIDHRVVLVITKHVQKFSEQHNHGNIVRFYKNNTTAQVYIYIDTLSSSRP